MAREAPAFNGLYMNDPWVHYTPEREGYMPQTDDGTIDLKSDPKLRRFKGTSYHGNMDFDVPFMTEVGHNLWQGGCERNLVLPHEIEHVVSLYTRERYQVDHDLRTELYVTMSDATDQSFEQVDILAEWVNHCRTTGPTLVHCQAGLNRSSLIVARALYLNNFGEHDGHPLTGKQIIKHLRELRSPAVLCNPAFEREVRSWK
jgi:protein-tyrosine phosphatase